MDETCMCACAYTCSKVKAQRTAVIQKQLHVCVRSYCVYKNVWAAAVGEKLACVREKENSHNIYVVSVKKNGVIFVNLPVASFHCSSKCFTYLRIDMTYNVCVL